MTQPADTEGKYPQRLLRENLEDPSARNVAFNRYFSL